MKKKPFRDNKNFVISLIVLFAILVGIAGYRFLRPFHIQRYFRSFPSVLISKLSLLSRSNVPDTFSGSVYPELSPEDRKAAFTFPSPNATHEERQHYETLVSRLAQDSVVLSISSCRPSPVILRVDEGSEFTIKNTGSGDSDLKMTPKQTYHVPAHGEIRAKADFFPGVYGYECAGQQTIGILFVVGK